MTTSEQSEGRIRVVYILSTGRSGSTVLDLLLGMHSTAWTLGEAQLLPLELRHNRRPCGCGRPLPACPFWSPVVAAICATYPVEYPVDHFRESLDAGRVLRWSLLFDVWNGRPRTTWKHAVRAYGENNRAMLGHALARARAMGGESVDTLVDASKDPYRLLWLQWSGLFDLRVIHLVKDPRAFAYSMIKPNLPGATRQLARFTTRWIVQNAIFNRICCTVFRPDRVLRLTYEELASQPRIALDRIGSWLGRPFPTDTCDLFRQAENHGISGGHARWEDTPIHLDVRWRHELPLVYSRFIELATRSSRRIFDYRYPEGAR